MRALPFVVLVFAATAPAQEKETAESVALRLGEPDVAVRRAAVEKLLELRPDLARLRVKLLSITAEPQEQRWSQVMGLGGFDTAGPDVEETARRLEDPDPEVRARAVRTLCSCGSAAADYQETLLAMLSDEDADVRAAVAKHIAQLGWNDEVRAALLQALKDRASAVRKAAAETLGADRGDAGIVAALRGAVQDPDLDVRANVIRSLGKCGEAGRAAADDIVAMLRDREARVRVAALDAVRSLELRDARAVAEVTRCLDEADRKVLEAALRAVMTMKAAAAGATARTLELTHHERDEVRIQALSAAWHVAPEERRGAVILRVVEALGDPHKKVASRAESHLLQLVRDS